MADVAPSFDDFDRSFEAARGCTFELEKLQLPFVLSALPGYFVTFLEEHFW